jgi:hypothetical protein
MLRAGPIASAGLRVCGWACVLLATVCCRAQQDQTPVFTLKVYANLVQVPTLVLDHGKHPLPPVDFSRFMVSLDGGRKFAPTRVRVEGDDPLDLAILLDMSGPERHLIANFAEAAAKMAHDSLHVQDHVSVYAVNCHLVRSARRVAADPELVSAAVKAATEAPGLNEGYEHGRCPNASAVWDAIAAVANDMADSPNRRAMLVVSNGGLPGKTSWAEIHWAAGDRGVAIFGLNDGGSYLWWQQDNTDPFRSLCDSTGGIVMYASNKDLDKRLEEWVKLLRGRYVVEFPNPQRLASGRHTIQISIKRDDMAFVTFAGVSTSLPDPKLTSDPNYLPSSAGADIPVGTRRPMTK